jgi:hypothetical protein
MYSLCAAEGSCRRDQLELNVAQYVLVTDWHRILEHQQCLVAACSLVFLKCHDAPGWAGSLHIALLMLQG